MPTSVRILELLGLLQNRRHWSGVELAEELGVSPRTLRRDVDGLRELGYPITTTRGTGGGYQLSAGASLPPLVLNEDEAAAVVLGLKEVAAGGEILSGDAAVSAMAKIVQVLPDRIRRRIDSLRDVAVARVQPSARITDIACVTTVALACRDHDCLRFTYRSRDGRASDRVVHPHRTVSVENRLYLLGWDLDRADWRTFRLDRIDDPRRTGSKFAPRPLPSADPVAYVRGQIRSAPSRYPVHATVHAPADRVRRELGDFGEIQSGDGTTSEVFIPADSLDWAAFCLAAMNAPFTVHSPPEAVEHMRRWGQRLIAASQPPDPHAGGGSYIPGAMSANRE